MEVLLTKDYILRLLEKKGMSKSDFAKSMGYKRQNVDTMLESKKKDINTIIKIAEVLDMPLEEFLYGNNGNDCRYRLIDLQFGYFVSAF